MPPEIEVRREHGSTGVYADDQLVVEIRNNRFLRFRSNIDNDHWIGTKARPADVGWSPNRGPVRGYENQIVQINRLPGDFTITLSGTKPNVHGTVEVTLQGWWDRQRRNFAYSLSSGLQADLAKWILA